MSFAKFMSGAVGRGIRIVAGLALIGVGLGSMGGANGAALAAVGALPLVAGLFNFCLFAPLFGGPFSGKKALES
jgi:hypothetical protein